MISDSEFVRRAEEAIRAGPATLATFLLEYTARRPHTHTADEITDFDESVTQVIEDTGEKIEDEDEDLLG
jgi:hypothetical protein